MLVYVRQSDLSEIMPEVTEQSLPAELLERFKAEEADSEGTEQHDLRSGVRTTARKSRAPRVRRLQRRRRRRVASRRSKLRQALASAR